MVTAAYGETCRWWEAVVMLRKLLLTIVATFIVNPILEGVFNLEAVFLGPLCVCVSLRNELLVCRPSVVWQPPLRSSYLRRRLELSCISDRMS